MVRWQCSRLRVGLEWRLPGVRWRDSMTGRLWLGFNVLVLFIMSAAIFVYAGTRRQSAVTATVTEKLHPLQVYNLRAALQRSEIHPGEGGSR